MEQHRDDLMHDFLQAKDAIFKRNVRPYCNGLGYEICSAQILRKATRLVCKAWIELAYM